MSSNTDNQISTNALKQVGKPSLFRKLIAIKSLFVAISISTLLFTNIASFLVPVPTTGCTTFFGLFYLLVVTYSLTRL
jgi:hypothetical protein